jgi:transporter family-2 protein
MNYGLAVLVGIALTLQIGLNAIVGARLGSPLLGAVVNFAVGLVALVAIAAFAAPRLQLASLASVPAWGWSAGLLGAAYVAVTTVLGPRLGAATLLALTLLGQFVAAALVDHYGIVGFPQHAFGWQRALGIALLLVGTLLIMRR